MVTTAKVIFKIYKEPSLTRLKRVAKVIAADVIAFVCAARKSLLIEELLVVEVMKTFA